MREGSDDESLFVMFSLPAYFDYVLSHQHLYISTFCRQSDKIDTTCRHVVPNLSGCNRESFGRQFVQ